MDSCNEWYSTISIWNNSSETQVTVRHHIRNATQTCWIKLKNTANSLEIHLKWTLQLIMRRKRSRKQSTLHSTQVNLNVCPENPQAVQSFVYDFHRVLQCHWPNLWCRTCPLLVLWRSERLQAQWPVSSRKTQMCKLSECTVRWLQWSIPLDFANRMVTCGFIQFINRLCFQMKMNYVYNKPHVKWQIECITPLIRGIVNEVDEHGFRKNKDHGCQYGKCDES